MGPDTWLAVEELGPDGGGDGGRTGSTPTSTAPYRRYCRAVLSGPLDQFVAGV